MYIIVYVFITKQIKTNCLSMSISFTRTCVQHPFGNFFQFLCSPTKIRTYTKTHKHTWQKSSNFFFATEIVLNDISQGRNKVCVLGEWYNEDGKKTNENSCIVCVYVQCAWQCASFFWYFPTYYLRRLVQSALSCNTNWITDQRTLVKKLTNPLKCELDKRRQKKNDQR